MARTIPQRELRNANAQVIDAVAAGQTFIVTRNGVPIAELRPAPTTRRRFVPRAELQLLAAGGTHVNADRFRADLDRIVDPGL